jgi:hypothetical protein
MKPWLNTWLEGPVGKKLEIYEARKGSVIGG